MAKKIEVSEADLKQIILIMKMSKPYVNIPPGNLRLENLWRVSGKLADKLMRKADLTLVTNNGKFSLKPTSEAINSEDAPKEETKEETATTEEVPTETPTEEVKSEEIPIETKEEKPFETPAEEPKKTPRCRKRKK